MTHRQGQSRDDEPVRGTTSAAGEGHFEHIDSIARINTLERGLREPDLRFRQGNGDPDDPDLHDLPSRQSSESEHWQRQHKAQVAFSSNSGITATTPRATAWKHQAPLSSTFKNVQHPESSADSQQALDKSASSWTAERPQDNWQSSLAIGSIDASTLGAREAARRHLLQWDQIYDFNKTRNSASLLAMENQRAEARRVYEQLCTSERDEDMVPKDQLPSYQKERIQARTALLRRTFLEAPTEGCEPMKDNITAAMNGYDDGTIDFSERYTLIYAGNIVDTTCKSYAEFTIDRKQRLDRYFDQYGPGYLWWEPPLAKGKNSMLAKRCTVLDLDREDDSFFFEEHRGVRYLDEASHYKVPLGFRKDDRLRCRLQSQTKSVVVRELQHEALAVIKRKRNHAGDVETELMMPKREKLSAILPGDAAKETLKSHGAEELSSSAPHMTPEPSFPAENMDVHEGIQIDNDGPTIFFDMLLDSGAELPILLHQDFELLGYGKQDMNAASVVELNAAAGQTSTALCFEMLVGLELGNCQSQYWMDHATYSEARFFPTRVIKLPPSIMAPDYGAFSGDRLSGMLPFLAYYLASAPGNSQLWLGERRSDVLGMENMPAGLKYDPCGKDNRTIRRERRMKIANLGGNTQRLRKVTFESDTDEGRTLIDQDCISDASKEVTSTITVLDKDGTLIECWSQDLGDSKQKRQKSISKGALEGSNRPSHSSKAA